MTDSMSQPLPIRRLPVRQVSSSTPSDGQTPALKRTRARAPRVRTGCTTCKIRRVKCDEGKPSCRRCVSTGRKCDGYASANKELADLNTGKTPPLQSTLSPYTASQEELRALQYFHLNTAPELGHFDSEFWTRLVFQAAHAEDCVRHAMIALGCLSERRSGSIMAARALHPIVTAERTEHLIEPITGSLPHTDPAPGDRFALSQYNRAITALGARMAGSSLSRESALLACILFICIEFMRGEIGPALQHFSSGMKITLDWLSSNSSAHDDLQTHLAFFNRLELLTSMFSIETTWNYTIALDRAVPRQFTSMRQARDSLIHVMNFCRRFIRVSTENKGTHATAAISAADLVHQSQLLQQVEAWRNALDALILSNKVTSLDLAGARALRLHMLICQIWTEVAPYWQECKRDEHLSHFEEAVSIAEAITGSSNASERPPTFLFDMEIVSPIYFVGMQCRDPSVRRRAIAVLKSSVRREGLWDSHKAAAVAERVMQIEEQSLSTLDGSELPAESDRIHGVNILSEPGAFPRQLVLTYLAQPDGYGGWKRWQEDLVLVPDADM